MSKKRREWRTRPDPFAEVWEKDVEPLLQSDPEGRLSATTILEWLEERHPGQYGMSQLRTLQRRVRDYRALHGPDREVCFGETFVALVKGLQGALWELVGVPQVVRTDNLSAATHELRDSRGRAMHARCEAVLAHYGLEATRTNPRSYHENGVVEQGHRRLKHAMDRL